MKGPPPGSGGEDITWPDAVAPRGRRTSSTQKVQPQTSILRALGCVGPVLLWSAALWSLWPPYL